MDIFWLFAFQCFNVYGLIHILSALLTCWYPYSDNRCPIGMLEADVKQIICITDFTEVKKATNISFRNGMYNRFLNLFNGAISLVDDQSELNWRWTNVNILLENLKYCEYGTKDFYNLDSEELNTVFQKCSSLPAGVLVTMLVESEMEYVDGTLSYKTCDLALADERCGNWGQAEKHYLLSLERDPHSGLILYNYAMLLGMLKQRKQTVNVLVNY